ncbi:MAG: rhodanese-like domain-containing protein [Bacteroidia bacterium]|nr:rhodanese-like domain-containing protein [Bacteroidia bacterium]MDW8015098.1 rhodanese-like domain-containing protein [Bacteroidia bacterium]
MRHNVVIVSSVLILALGVLGLMGGGSIFRTTQEPIILQPSEAYQRWKKEGNRVAIVDVRTPEEYYESHVKGAKNIDFYSDFENKVNELPKEKIYFLYCASGNRSKAAAQIMRERGLTAYSIGGLRSLAQVGFPIKKGYEDHSE